MKKQWEVSGGGITGTEHRRIGRNSQDAYYSISDEQATIAIVCDGCGSGQHSEVGAQIGVRLVAETLRISLTNYPNSSLSDDFWEEVRENVLTRLQNLAIAMGGDGYSLDPEIIHHYFLFTIVGVLLIPSEVTVFSIGDGVIVINGYSQKLGSFPNNAPPYLAYELLSPGAEEWKFQIHTPIAMENLESILVGTDGVCDLIAAAGKKLPGKDELVGEICQFWQEDRYFKNTDAIRRKLALINRDITKADWHNQRILQESGLLPDDTSFVVIRNRDQPGT